MKIDRCAEFIIDKLNEAGYKAYLVGGCVRDSIIGRPVHDWDICTSALPEIVYNLFGEMGLTVIDTGMKYGTVSVILSDLDIDMINQDDRNYHYLTESNLKIYEITTFRKASGARKMDAVEFTDSLEEDLMRRDFTINALAYHPKEGIIDITGGLKDIDDKLIRCIKEPETRFYEDYIRILRAIRFEAQLGFDIESNTYFWVQKMAEQINHTSPERIQSEFIKMICSDHVEKTLLNNAEVIGYIIPEIKETIGFVQNTPHHKYDVYVHSVKTVGALANQGFGDSNLRIAALLHDIGKPLTVSIGKDRFDHYPSHASIGALLTEKILRRLNFSNSDIKEITTIVKYHDLRAESKSAIKRLMNKVGQDTHNKILMIRHADILAQSSHDIYSKIVELRQMREWFDEVVEGNEAFKLSDLEISGNDLIGLGYQPGVKFGTILTDVYNLVMEDRISNTKELLVDYVLTHYPV